MAPTTDCGTAAGLAAHKSRSASPPPLSMLPWVFGDVILIHDLSGPGQPYVSRGEHCGPLFTHFSPSDIQNRRREAVIGHDANVLASIAASYQSGRHSRAIQQTVDEGAESWLRMAPVRVVKKQSRTGKQTSRPGCA